jgi:hypothetical protein
MTVSYACMYVVCWQDDGKIRVYFSGGIHGGKVCRQVALPVAAM